MDHLHVGKLSLQAPVSSWVLFPWSFHFCAESSIYPFLSYIGGGWKTAVRIWCILNKNKITFAEYYWVIEDTVSKIF